MDTTLQQTSYEIMQIVPNGASTTIFTAFHQDTNPTSVTSFIRVSYGHQVSQSCADVIAQVAAREFDACIATKGEVTLLGVADCRTVALATLKIVIRTACSKIN